MTDLDALLSRVRDRVTPDADERQALDAAVAALTDRAEAAVADLPVSANVVQVGSTARGTWLAGDRDIDLFVRFPADLPREDLERYGLQVGHEVLPDGHEEYAEHPYVKGAFDGFDVDLVPCYDVPAATDIRSAVDRTPFHNAFLTAHLDPDLAGEVRTFKAFLKGVGVYGSDLKTRGFSGYLTELLVLEYGSVPALLRGAADWRPPVHFDPADHAAETFDDPLVVVDPTDPERNVAAVCSAESVARLQHHARVLLDDPSEEPFVRDDPDPLSPADVRAHLARRGTTPLALVFDAPDLVDDQLWPQLEKSRRGVASALDRRGFTTLRSVALAEAGGRGVLCFELTVAELPDVTRHEGPPVHVRDHAAGFVEKYAGGDAYGPFVDGDRYVVEREREFTSAVDLLRSDALFDAALGAHVESALEDSDVWVGDEVAGLADDFGVELARYFDPKP